MAKTPEDHGDKSRDRGAPLAGTAGSADSAVVFAFNVAMLTLTMGTQSLLAWSLEPSGRGIYAIWLLFGLLFGAVFTLGIDRSAQNSTISGQLDLSRSVFTASLVTLLGSMVAVVVLLSIAGIYPGLFVKFDIDLLWLSTPLIPLTILFIILQLQVAGLRRFMRLGQINLAQIAANLVLLVLLTWGFDGGVAGAIVSYEISLALGIGLFLRDLRRNCGLTPVLPTWRQMAPVILYGAKYHAARIGQLVDLQIGVILLGLMATSAEVGVYAAASALAFRLAIIPQSIETAILPRIAADAADRTVLIGKAIRVSAILTAAAAGVLALISVPLVPILLSPAFSEATTIIWILAPAAIFQGTSLILMAHFRSINRPGIISWVVVVSILVSSLSLLILYPRYGLPGAGLAIALGVIARALALFCLYKPAPGGGRFELFRFTWEDPATIWKLLTRIAARLAAFGGNRRG